mmetsp:Transcript_14614/g.34000  ORF Transcript_14614/g.34000 Transcript_14614/m.34000 type:complete len:87 (-) Transcript_14614:774-1034(-)
MLLSSNIATKWKDTSEFVVPPKPQNIYRIDHCEGDKSLCLQKLRLSAKSSIFYVETVGSSGGAISNLSFWEQGTPARVSPSLLILS